MKKIALLALVALLLIGSFYCGQIIGKQQTMYSSMNGSMYSKLVIYDMLEKNQADKSRDLLERLVSYDYYSLKQANRLDKNLEDTPMWDVLHELIAKVEREHKSSDAEKLTETDSGKPGTPPSNEKNEPPRQP